MGHEAQDPVDRELVDPVRSGLLEGVLRFDVNALPPELHPAPHPPIHRYVHHDRSRVEQAEGPDVESPAGQVDTAGGGGLRGLHSYDSKSRPQGVVAISFMRF